MTAAGNEGAGGDEGFVFAEEAPGESPELPVGQGGAGDEDDAEESREGDAADVPEEMRLLGDEDDGESEDEGDEEGKHGDLRDHPRFQTLKRQRDEARTAKGEVEQRLSEITKEHETLETALQGWEGLFGEYDDPLGAAQRMMAFVQEAEVLSRSDPGARELVEALFQGVERRVGGEGAGGVVTRLGARQGGERQRGQSRKEGGEVDETLREVRTRDAESMVDEILERNRVAPTFRKAIRRAALGGYDATSKPTREAMRDLVLAAIKESGWTPRDVTSDGKPARRRPPTGGRSGGAVFRQTGQRARSSEGGGKAKGQEPKDPETPQEGEAKRARLFDGLLGRVRQSAS